MENTQTRGRKVIKISRKKLIILIIIVVVLAIGFVLSKKTRPVYNTMEISKSMGGISIPSVQSPYPYFEETTSIKDTREFMKVNYGAELKTRNVKDAIRDVKNAINDADGRIDNLNETTKYAYVSFVIPKSNLNNFKDEIESITNEKLYTENISSQNLLSQKQSIEQQQETARASLVELQNKQKDLIGKHTQAVSNLQNEIIYIQNQLISVRATIDITSDEDTLVTLRNQEYDLSQQETSLKQSLNSENLSFNTKNQNLKNQIENINTQIKNINKQDVQFAENIETVNGYVSINWISLWDMAKIFSPIHPTIIIIILVLLVWYYLRRKNYIPSIELE